MYARILVPLDGSELAERALPWARTIAARSGGEVRLVHVHVPMRIPTSHAVLGPRAGRALEKLGEDRREEAEAYLEELGRRLADEASKPEFSTALLRGPKAASVARDARSSKAALIVMAPRRDRKLLERLRDGSVTEELARSGPVPVLAVRGEVGEADGGTAGENGEPFSVLEAPACGGVLVPLDGTRRCEAAVEHASAMAELFDAPVVLVRVEPPGQWAAQPAATYLEEVADGIHRAGVRVETRVLAGNDVVGAVNAMAEETDAGMIVVGSRYHGGLPRLSLGGLAETFVRTSPVPVLVVNGRCVEPDA